LETHEEEKDSDARLESCDAVICLVVQPTDEHAEYHGYHDMRKEERLVPKLKPVNITTTANAAPRFNEEANEQKRIFT